MKLRSFILGDLLYAAVLGAALVALGIGFSLTSSTGEQSKLAYDGNLWCVSNYIEARDSQGRPVYLKDGRPRKDERLDSKIDWVRKEQIEADSKEEAEQKATSEYFKSSNADELRAWLDANDKANFTTHFNTGATTPGPCLGSGWGNGMAGKWVNDGINEDCFGLASDQGCGFDISKLTLYEDKSSGSDPGAEYSQKVEARQYAIETLGIDASQIKQFPKSEVENMIRAEIARQWAEVSNKHGATQEQAQRAILSYQEHEDSRFQLIGPNGTPSYTFASENSPSYTFGVGRPAVTNLLSLSNDKFNSKNKRIAGSYDIKYTIYLGIRENMGAFQSSRVSGEGEQRWKNAIGYVFLPSNPQRYWTDSRSGVANKAWENYSGETAYVCPTATAVLAAVAPSTGSTPSNNTIVIDPGHGSAANTRPNEDKIMVQIGLILSKELKSSGYNTVLTHSSVGEAIGGITSDENKDNIARANIVNDAKPVITVRLHSDDRNDNSYWVIYPDKKGEDRTGATGPLSDTVIPKSREFAKILDSTLKSAGYSGITKGESQYNSASKGDLLVLSAHSKYPVVTLEIYGHNSSSLRQKYSQNSEQKKLAEAITQAVKNFAPISQSSSLFPFVNKASAAEPTAVPEKIDGAPGYCPDKPMAGGPSTGEDYQLRLAKQYEQELGEIGWLNSNNGGGYISENVTAPPQSALRIAQIAANEIGKEERRGENDVKYNNYNNAEWCGYFVTWVMREAGFDIPLLGGSRAIFDWFRTNQQVFSDPSQAEPGDIVVWKRGPETGHIVIVIENNRDRGVLVLANGNSGRGSRDRVSILTKTYSQINNSFSGLLGLGRWRDGN